MKRGIELHADGFKRPHTLFLEKTKQFLMYDASSVDERIRLLIR